MEAPAPYSRCKSFKAHCAFDDSFRGISKDKQLADLQAEVSELRDALALAQAQARESQPQSSYSAESVDASPPEASPSLSLQDQVP